MTTAFGSKVNTITTQTHRAVDALIERGVIADDLLTRDDAYAALMGFYDITHVYCETQQGHEARTDAEPKPHCKTVESHRKRRGLETGHGPGVRRLLTKAVDEALDTAGID